MKFHPVAVPLVPVRPHPRIPPTDLVPRHQQEPHLRSTSHRRHPSRVVISANRLSNCPICRPSPIIRQRIDHPSFCTGISNVRERQCLPVRVSSVRFVVFPLVLLIFHGVEMVRPLLTVVVIMSVESAACSTGFMPSKNCTRMNNVGNCSSFRTNRLHLCQWLLSGQSFCYFNCLHLQFHFQSKSSRHLYGSSWSTIVPLDQGITGTFFCCFLFSRSFLFLISLVVQTFIFQLAGLLLCLISHVIPKSASHK